MKKIIGFIALVMALVIAPIEAQADGNIVPKCEKSCPTEGGKCTQTCKINVEGNDTSLTTVTAQLNISGSGVTVKSFDAGDGWQVVSPTSTEMSGTSIPISLVSTTGISSANFTLATFTLEVESSTTDCSLKISNPSIGSEVTVEVETTTETKTGATLPLAIVGCGLVGVVVIYSLTKKNKKMYKI